MSCAKAMEINVTPDGLQPGKVFIINTTRFNDKSLKERDGSVKDVTRLISVLDKFHMGVEFILDANCNDIKSLMERISKQDFSKLSCLMVVIMSHGYEGNMIAAKDGTYSLCQDILYPILQNKTLEDKLKMIVTQACEGPVNALNIPFDGPIPTAIPSEILQLYSSKEDSVFITTFCDLLEKHGFSEDILKIADKVVANLKEKIGNTQTPMIHSNVTKNIVLGHFVKMDAAPVQPQKMYDGHCCIISLLQ